ncbi:MGMT family protein [Brachybacterium sp. AOP25-B2-12]|uniref:MGMT family protein n=1 Tax=Brachybacterium sp. AOP25-B2-12 TaxID=3457710 RepID=UPI004033D65E
MSGGRTERVPADGPPRRARMDDLTIEKVLRTVEQIPAGRVAGYGQIGAIVGVGPRLVGRILREWGASVPWWRVTSSSGDHPLLARAREHWEAEGIALKPNGLGCRMSEFGADLDRLRADARSAWADLG